MTCSMTGFMSVLVLGGIFAGADDEGKGKELPRFTVESGDGKELSTKDLSGKVVVLTYETRQVVEKNRKAKEALGKICEEEFPEGACRVVPIVDTSSSNFLTRPIWRSKLRENSKKESLTIYGDWDGSAAKALGVKRNESNLIIVDSKGIVRYVGHGRFDEAEVERQKEVLLSLRKPKDAEKKP